MTESVKVLQEHIDHIIDSEDFGRTSLNPDFIASGYYLAFGKSLSNATDILIF